MASGLPQALRGGLSARELPARIARECKWLIRGTGLTKQSRHGDYIPNADLWGVIRPSLRTLTGRDWSSRSAGLTSRPPRPDYCTIKDAVVWYKELQRGSPAPLNAKKIGECIYCGTRDATLGTEHAVPYGLNGPWTLLNASCDMCAKITHRLERDTMRCLWPDIRNVLGSIRLMDASGLSCESWRASASRRRPRSGIWQTS